MEDKLAIRQVQLIDQKTIDDYLFATNTTLTKEQKTLFGALAMRNQLDPFKREIYAVPYNEYDDNGKVIGTKMNVVTGYEVYLKRAEESGQLDGWKVWVEGEGTNMKAKIEIWRKDRSKPFEHEVDIIEYDLGKSLWKKKKKTMLKKVVIAQGFRLDFPLEVGRLPYTTEEIDIVNELPAADIIDIIPETVEATNAEEAKQEIVEGVTDEQGEQIKNDSQKKCDEFLARMKESKNIFELKNWWRKHNAEIAKLLPEHSAFLDIEKGKLKDKFDAKTN